MHDFSLLIADWYRQNKRDLPWRKTKDPYLIWLSEIILQQTRIEQGLRYFDTFKQNYPTIHDLAEANEQQVLNDWQGLGYYSRARNLHATAKYVSIELNGRFPQTHDEIIKLKGVGPYTAAAISSFAFNESKAVVDGNVYRFISRLFDIDQAIDSTQGKKRFQEIADQLIQEVNPSIHNQAMMEMGSLVCKPTPLCGQCPVSHKCLALEAKTVRDRPVKEKKTKVRKRYFHYLIFESEGRIAIEQRTGKDIWQHLFQFPLLETDSKEIPDLSAYSVIHQSDSIKHILSHQHIFATFYHIDGLPKKLEKGVKIIHKRELQDHPLPRIIDRYLEEQVTR